MARDAAAASESFCSSLDGPVCPLPKPEVVRRNPYAPISTSGGSKSADGWRAITGGQRLTLVHFSAQLERFVWDRGCA
jgi:hypothetical protein